MMDKASIIRQSLSMRTVAEYYGFMINNRGYISCPFHTEKSCSCKIYSGSRGFSCFGCNESGSVIDFVMKLFQINFIQAISMLNNDFGLNLSDEKPSIEAINQYKQKQQAKKRYEANMKLVDEWWILEFKKTYRIFTEQKPKRKFEELTDEFIKALCELPYIEERLTKRG